MPRLTSPKIKSSATRSGTKLQQMESDPQFARYYATKNANKGNGGGSGAPKSTPAANKKQRRAS